MDRFREMEVFAAVAEAGGLAAAARDLGLSPPAVTRALQGLEARLGAQLIHRTTRSQHLTEAGAQYLAEVRRILDAVAAAEAELADRTETPSGRVALTASLMFGRQAVAPALAGFLTAHPAVSVRMVLEDRPLRLVEDGYDVGVRIGVQKSSSLIARTLGGVRRVAVASPGYLARRGRPERLEDLAGHDIVEFSRLAPGGVLTFGAESIRVGDRSRAQVNDIAAAMALAEQGAGICTVLSYAVDGAVRAGRLVELGPPFQGPLEPVQFLFPAPVSRATRALMDHIGPELTRHLRALTV